MRLMSKKINNWSTYEAVKQYIDLLVQCHETSLTNFEFGL